MTTRPSPTRLPAPAPLLFLLLAAAGPLDEAGPGPGPGADPVDLVEFVEPRSEMQHVVERYAADRDALEGALPSVSSPARIGRLRRFYEGWAAALGRLDFDAMGPDGRIDSILLGNHLDRELRELDRREAADAETRPLLPFAATIVGLEESRRRLRRPDPAEVAGSLTELTRDVEKARKRVEDGPKAGEGDAGPRASKAVANRAAEAVDSLRGALGRWFASYDGYDPAVTWWVAEPQKAADKALKAYADALREKVVGVKPGDEEAIVGDPIGREALRAELAHELIPYEPEELVAIAGRELAWCEAEMKKAAREMGCGDDWETALERVKARHVEPGGQPTLIRDLAAEAIGFLDDRGLITIPPLARETWRMEMMSPRRQLVNPFFTGGRVISVSFPTAGMTHEQKLMSMRGNNIHFARATVHHELIPGHHLQKFMAERYRPYRRPFETPFFVEGWALYWEMVLWDKGFPKTPEDRVGMLFWRSHRCARIAFSLGFHLGKMSPRECIDLLVDRVGHEPANAAAEVRRSFNGSYSPLYQSAYMLGALQLRALRRELVDTGRMGERAFHDAVLRENAIPVELIRARLTGQDLPRDFATRWKFYGPIPWEG